jgi:predicted 3-demethylubiquinone-9 3-methyltransferase (glyoxalase superfamily)
MVRVRQKISPYLWFDSQAEEAMNFYIDVFNKAPYGSGSSKVTSILRYASGMETPGMPAMEGKVLTGEFELEGQKFLCLDGGPVFKFNESISLLIECRDQKEVDYFYEKLSSVPEAEICGWLKDRYGLSWQVIPTRMLELVNNKNLEVSKKAVNAMLKMKKIIIADLEKAVEK